MRVMRNPQRLARKAAYHQKRVDNGIVKAPVMCCPRCRSKNVKWRILFKSKCNECGFEWR